MIVQQFGRSSASTRKIVHIMEIRARLTTISRVARSETSRKLRRSANAGRTARRTSASLVRIHSLPESPAMRSTLAAALGLLLAAGSLPAQGPGPGGPGGPGGAPPAGPGEVKGTIVDQKSAAPVARASVTIRNKATSAIVTGAIAGANGAFRVQGLRPGAYTVRFTFLGFAPKMQEIAVTPAAPIVDVGTIQLTRVAVALGEVEVVDKQDAVTIEPDRNSYRAKDVAPAATNASQVLEATPSVTVDADGKVSLRGNENVAVQINGRPAPIAGAQLGAYLKSLPAGVLDRVEVVPNPSAKYDPEGMAGIINIVLKQNVDLGISAGLTVGAANRDRYNASGNLGYQAGRLTTFSNLGIYNDKRDVIGINDRYRYDASNVLFSEELQEIVADNGFRGENFRSEEHTSELQSQSNLVCRLLLEKKKKKKTKIKLSKLQTI